jgi:hypothetical protein
LDDFQEILQSLDSALRPFEYEIRSTHPQKSRNRQAEDAIYAVVNITSDPQTQLATANTPDEIAFVKRVLDAMFDTNNTEAREVMAVRSMDAVNLARAPARQNTQTQRENTVANGNSTQGAGETQTGGSAASINKTDADRILNELVENNWFEKSTAGYFSLGTRGIMELGRWLVATYNEPEAEQNEWQRIKNCTGCRQIITVGQRCTEDQCGCRLHEYCVNKYFEQQAEGDKKCPVCRADWLGNRFVGEKAARREAPSLGGAGGRPSAGRGRR